MKDDSFRQIYYLQVSRYLQIAQKAHSPGAFRIINKSVNVCNDTTNTSYKWGCLPI